MQTQTFDYRPGIGMAIALLIIAVLFAGIFLWMALENNTRLEIFGMVLSVGASTALFWGCALFFGAGIPIGGKMIAQSMYKPRHVILHDTSITAPKSGLSSKTKTLNFRDITGHKVWSVQGNTMMELKTSTQKLVIPKTYIRPANQFDALAAAIEKRITAARING